MTWLIGIDEAGYGPNLGPLVVGATVWRVEGAEARDQGSGIRRGRADRAGGSAAIATPATGVDLYQRLSSLICAAPTDEQLAIADSKALYKPGGGLRQLERGVLAARAAVDGDVAARWSDLFTMPDAESLPWYAGYDCALPIDATSEEIAELRKRFTSICVSAGVQLVDMRTRVVFPREFNDLVDHFGTKGAALSHISIGLLQTVLEECAGGAPAANGEPCFVTCDKHGGRNRYAALLQHHFPDDWIETLEESRPLSRYAWGPPESAVTVAFRTKGEAELPTALASMAAKYHRELAMRAFNAFWTAEVPNLKPTAGYPQDAKRYKKAIAQKQRELNIDDRDLWRNR